MKERSAEGIPGRQERDYISKEHEEILWEKGILGEDNPDRLRKTIFFLVGVRFGLRGCKEQHDLRRYPDSQISIIKVDGKDALIYREFTSKTRQGAFRIVVKSTPEFPMHFVLVIDLVALLNCTGNIYFWDQREVIIGQGLTCKLT